MKFEEPLIPCKILKRYKRFLADVELESGEVITVHVPNSGSMKTCWQPGWDARISDSHNPNRKYRHTLEMTHNGTCWICVNTQIPNLIAFEAIEAGRIEPLSTITNLRREVKYGENSRIDVLGEDEKTGQLCYIEVKNTTLVQEAGHHEFPDAVTGRGKKHLLELMTCVKEGHRAVMLFVINRSDGTHFSPAWGIDPEYSKTLVKAVNAGVEILPCQSAVSPDCVELTGEILPHVLDCP